MEESGFKTIGEGEEQCIYTWRVEQFTSLETDQPYQSSTFWGGFPGLCEARWRLQLYPNGYNTESNGWISLYVILVSSTADEFDVDGTISIFNEDSPSLKVVEKKFQHKFEKTKTGRFGFLQFIKRTIILGYYPAPGYLNDGTLSIRCKFNEFSVPRTREHESNNAGSQAAVLHKGLWQQYADQSHVDAIILVGGKQYKVHKIILAAYSPVFASMFQVDMLETRNNLLTIEDCDPEVFEEFLRFIYSGKFEDLRKVDARLIAVAEKYEVEELKSVCEKSMDTNLSVGNSLETLQIADLYRAPWLKSQTLKFIERHALAILNTEGWNAVMGGSALMKEVFTALATLIDNLRG